MSPGLSLRSLRPLRCIFLFFLLAYLPCPAAAQDSPILNIDEDCVAMAIAPDGRIAYAVRRIISVRRIDMQRDDIWVSTLGGKKKRIVDGEKLVRSSVPYSYTVRSLTWSPDGTRLTVELFTTAMIDERGNTQDEQINLLLDQEGKEIKIEGTKNSIIPSSYQAAWLGDGVTIAYLTEAVKPRLLFAVNTVRPVSGLGGRIFDKSIFAAVSWDLPHSTAVAIERNAQLTEPPTLVLLDLAKQTRRELAQLSGYFGQLAISPSGTKVAYYSDPEIIEVREIANPAQVIRMRVALGTFQWAKDEKRLLVKRGTEKRSADLVWVHLPDGRTESIMHSLTFRDFELSPDGRYLAVMSPGKRTIQIYELPRISQ